MDIMRLHEQLLRYNGSNWQYHGEVSLNVPENYRDEMGRLAEVRERKSAQWGFKEPRTTLFFPAWYTILKNPYTIVV